MRLLDIAATGVSALQRCEEALLSFKNFGFSWRRPKQPPESWRKISTQKQLQHDENGQNPQEGLIMERCMRTTVAILVLLAAGGLAARAGNDSLEFVYNCFIARFADGNPAWKTEITLEADLNKPPQPPYRLHYNDSLGYYTYRPKHWSELNDYEQFALRNDPRLSDFIRQNADSLRNGQFGVFAGSTNATQTALKPGAGARDQSNNARTGRLEHAPAADATSVDSQNVGVLSQEGENRWGYRFEPGDLLNSKPLRLVEAAP
jgi:hypothetical protein